MSFTVITILLSFTIYLTNSAQVTGWVYADNWFEMYFNGEKVATDPLTFYPHNAVYINFTAPDTGLYSYAIWTQDFANDTTGLERRISPDGSEGGWCIGDGGIWIALDDGTVSGSNWQCYIVHEGPIESACQASSCLGGPTKPSDCTVTVNNYPSCWYETTCAAATSANGWVDATEYTANDIGWGRSPKSTPETFGYTYPEVCSGLDATSTEQIYIDEGCEPQTKNWGTAKPMWTSSLDYHNRIICRYEHCVGNCDVATGAPSASPITSALTNTPSASPVITPLTPEPSKSPVITQSADTGAPSMSPVVKTALTSQPSSSPNTKPPTVTGQTYTPTMSPVLTKSPTGLPTITGQSEATNAPSASPSIMMNGDSTNAPSRSPNDDVTYAPTSSPEEVQGGNKVDRLCIVISIGIVLINMII